MKEKITIRDIAERAGTSKTTVSFFLNGKTDKMSEETQARIAQVIKETNYRPSIAARSLNAKETRLIGVIIGDITNTFANQIVKGIDDFARDNRYQLIVGNSNYNFENEKGYVNRMLAMGVDGFIIQPSSHFAELIPKIKQENKDVVFIDSQVSMDKEKWVKTNNYESILNVGTHLINDGYDEFIMITADPHVLSTRLERTTGFLHALETKGKTCKTHVVADDVTSDALRDLLYNELSFGVRTLIFVANCFLLPRVYLALKDYRNLMPDTIGLIGFDNTEWTNFSSPTVTTIVQPAYDEGYQAASILIDSLKGENKQIPNQILKCSVNWNESTKQHN